MANVECNECGKLHDDLVCRKCYDAIEEEYKNRISDLHTDMEALDDEIEKLRDALANMEGTL